MEVQQNNELEATNSKDFDCQVESFVQEDDLTKLRRENVLLRHQLKDAWLKQLQSDCRLAAAERIITALRTQPVMIRHDLVNSENTVTSLNLKVDIAKEKLKKLKKQQANAAATVRMVCAVDQCTTASQTDERDLSELSLQLQLKEDHQDLEEEAANNHKDKDVLIQQLQDTLSTEKALKLKNETLALELEVELCKKNFALKEAQIKAGQLEKQLLRMQEELKGELSAAQKKAEERLQIHLKEWQDERASLQKAIELLQQTLKEKQQKWSEEEREMGSRVDKLEKRMIEMLENRSEEKKCWLARLFPCFG